MYMLSPQPTFEKQHKAQPMSQANSDPPRVGIGVFVFKSKSDPRFVLGRRKGSHGAGTFALPGGHLERGESFETCARREVVEETGLEVSEVQFVIAANSVFQNGEGEVDRHYITIFMKCVVAAEGAEPINKEPHKCDGWLWRTFSEMEEGNINGQGDKEELFLPLKCLIEQQPFVCESLRKGYE